MARNAKAGVDVRAEGVGAMPEPLRFYVSEQVHSCHQKALVILGLGHKALRLVPTDAQFRIKWLNAPFEAGCALVRDARLHQGTFALHPEYLEEHPRGVAGAEYLFDYGIELSRGFKALKVWMSLKEHGVEKFGRLIDQNIAQAQYLARLVEAEPRLEPMAPAPINIVCFRHRLPGASETALKAFNTEIMLRLQEAGTATFSDTTLLGRHSLRVAIANHRTRQADLDLLVGEVLRVGAELQRN